MSPAGGIPPSETTSLFWPSMELGLNRQNSDRRNQGSNQLRISGTWAIESFREKLSVFVTAMVSVVDPDALPPSLKEPQPTAPPADHLVLLLWLSSSTFSVFIAKLIQPDVLVAKLPGNGIVSLASPNVAFSPSGTASYSASASLRHIAGLRLLRSESISAMMFSYSVLAPSISQFCLALTNLFF